MEEAMIRMYLSLPDVRADVEQRVIAFLERSDVFYVALYEEHDNTEGVGNASVHGTPAQVVPQLATLAYRELGIDPETRPDDDALAREAGWTPGAHNDPSNLDTWLDNALAREAVAFEPEPTPAGTVRRMLNDDDRQNTPDPPR